MVHEKAYQEGRITLKQYRKLQGLKLAMMHPKTKERKIKLLRKYLHEERKLGI